VKLQSTYQHMFGTDQAIRKLDKLRHSVAALIQRESPEIDAWLDRLQELLADFAPPRRKSSRPAEQADEEAASTTETTEVAAATATLTTLAQQTDVQPLPEAAAASGTTVPEQC